MKATSVTEALFQDYVRTFFRRSPKIAKRFLVRKGPGNGLSLNMDKYVRFYARNWREIDELTSPKLDAIFMQTRLRMGAAFVANLVDMAFWECASRKPRKGSIK